MNQTFKCQVFNQTITENIDEIRCDIRNFSASLYYYDVGYYCMEPLGLIVIISIFGGIKANYRWFILNQAIWDLLVTHQFSCANLLQPIIKPQLSSSTSRCYGPNEIYQFIAWFVQMSSSSALLLLSVSRFMALYYTKIYEKFTKKLRILFAIIFFNFIVILFDSLPLLLSYRLINRTAFVVSECKNQGNFSAAECNAKSSSDFLIQFLGTATKIFLFLSFVKPVICVSFSIFATAAICLKGIKNAKFQLKHNRTDFLSSVRISAVFCLQIFVNFLFITIESIYFFERNTVLLFNLKVFSWRIPIPRGKDPKEYLDFRLPIWLNGINGLSDDVPRQMLSQVRIITESMIVLFLMTGYREALIKSIKFFFTFIHNPKKAYSRFLSHLTQVTSIATNITK